MFVPFQCKHDSYRLLRYDMDSSARQQPPLLVQKHAVTPGMVLVSVMQSFIYIIHHEDIKCYLAAKFRVNETDYQHQPEEQKWLTYRNRCFLTPNYDNPGKDAVLMLEASFFTRRRDGPHKVWIQMQTQTSLASTWIRSIVSRLTADLQSQPNPLWILTFPKIQGGWIQCLSGSQSHIKVVLPVSIWIFFSVHIFFQIRSWAWNRRLSNLTNNRTILFSHQLYCCWLMKSFGFCFYP